MKRALACGRLELMALPAASIACAAIPISARQRGGAPPAAPAMTMSLPVFSDGGHVTVRFGQAAEGAAPGEGSPAINWANAPAGTQSFSSSTRSTRSSTCGRRPTRSRRVRT